MKTKALDYMFLLQTRELDIESQSEITVKKGAQVNIQKTKLEKLLMEGEKIPCRQCSDHYGISTVIE